MRQGVDVALDAEGAREAEVRLNFAQGGGHSVLTMVGVDEIKDLLLPVGEGFAHSVQMNTSARKCKPANCAID